MNTQTARPQVGITPNLFGIPYGLAGLATCWGYAAILKLVPALVADVLFIIVALVWLVLVVGYVSEVPRRPGGWRAELADPVLGPFVSLIPIIKMLLAIGLLPHAPVAGRWLFAVFAAVTTVMAGWLTGQWIVEDLDLEKLHSGYVLPAVAGGLHRRHWRRRCRLVGAGSRVHGPRRGVLAAHRLGHPGPAPFSTTAATATDTHPGHRGRTARPRRSRLPGHYTRQGRRPRLGSWRLHCPRGDRPTAAHPRVPAPRLHTRILVIRVPLRRRRHLRTPLAQLRQTRRIPCLGLGCHPRDHRLHRLSRTQAAERPSPAAPSCHRSTNPIHGQFMGNRPDEIGYSVPQGIPSRAVRIFSTYAPSAWSAETMSTSGR